MSNYCTPIQRLQVVREGSFKRRPRITCTQTARKFAEAFFAQRGADRECFVVAHLDTKHRPLSIEVCTVGTLDASLVHPREVFKAAIVAGASAVLLMHNHPSGDPTPSREDKAVTDRLEEVGKLIGITVLDHIVVGDDEGGSVSLREGA
ncbi:RadC family protein [Rhodopirellula sp. SWK7]|uniref:JAB domain-containing protein n=1 Tax=Rhodopirellula sp. SWK7 TaxID=595460 RepID=UPI001F48F83C|nr:JAB domain-containing protein [Rhodopirellula sp. SWK7]